jgi:transcriptional regulator with XRE-family HTH domain
MSEFTAWLEQELEERGWGYNQFGRLAGIAPGGVSQVMTGRQNPGLDFCLKVAKALDEPPDYISARRAAAEFTCPTG